jgi:plastocyanin
MKLIYSLVFGVGAFFSLNCGSGDEGGAYPAGAAPAAPPPSSTSATDPATIEVKVIGHEFDPQEVHIKANQSVRWVWVSGDHNVVSGAGCTPDGTFTSGAATSAPKTFEHSFASAGTFPYFCDPHCSIGMVGKVIVE